MKVKKIFFVFLVLLSCSKNKINEHNKKEEIVIADKELYEFKKSNYFNSDRVSNSKFKILKSGDKFAYADLVLFYSYNKTKRFEILPYSLIMVEKHKKYEYCSDVFNNILEFYTAKAFENCYNGEEKSLIPYLKGLQSMNQEQKNYAIYFLKKGANHNDLASVSYLEILNRYGIGIEKNIKNADSLKLILINIKKHYRHFE